VRRTLQSAFLIGVAALSVSVGSPANTDGLSSGQPLIIYPDGLKPGERMIWEISNVAGMLVGKPLTNIVGRDAKPKGDHVTPPGGGGRPGVPPGNAALGEVRSAFVELGKLDVFDQQVAVLQFSLKVATSLESRDQAYNSVFNLLEVTLGDYASPQWSPWVDPFIAAMENESDLAAFVAVVDAARASLSEGE